MLGKIALGAAALAGLFFAVEGTSHASQGGGTSSSHGGGPVTPPPPQNPGAISPDVLKIIEQAKNTANPAVLMNTADMLQAMGLTAAAQDLRALAAEIAAESGQAAVPAPAGTPPAPPVPLPLPPILPPPAPGQPAAPPVITVPPLVIVATPDDPGKALAGTLTAMLQDVARRGQEDKVLVGEFQQQELRKGTYTPLAEQFLDRKPTVADGLYGAVTALLVSSYGIVPVRPFYWSSDKSKAATQKAMFRSLMLEKAVSDPARATEWAAAANVANS